MPPCPGALMQSKIAARRWRTRADLVALLAKAHAQVVKTDGARLSLEAIAAQVGLSKYHFARLFESVYGSPPIRLRRAALLEAAKRRLQSSESIESIALYSGFSSASAFGRAFRRAFGAAPSQFRKIGRNSAKAGG